MNLSGLSLEQAPPISVPFRYFLSAPWIAALAPILLLFYPEAQSRWEPVVLFATHLIVVGYVLMIMTGALFQMVPVVGGVSFRHVRLLGSFTFVALLSILVALFLSFMKLEENLSIVPWSPLLFFPFLIFFGETLFRTKSSYETILAFRVSLVGLVLFLLLGGVLLAFRHLPQMEISSWWATLARPRGTDLHWIWALMGWVFPIVAGVSFQVLPMFFVTPPYPKLFRQSFPILLLLVVFMGTLELWFFQQMKLFHLLSTFLVGLFCLLSLNLLRQRKRKVRDLSVWFWRLSLGFALIALPISYSLDWLGPKGELLFGFTVLFGALVSLVSAMIYKIVPFLIWFHLQSAQMQIQMAATLNGPSPKPLPTMKDLISDQKVMIHFVLHTTGMLLLLLGSAVPLLKSGAFFVLACGFLLQGSLIYSAYRRF